MHHFQGTAGRHDPGRQAEGKAVLRRVVHCRGHFAFSGQHGSGRQLRNGEITDYDLASALQGAVVKDEDKDGLAWKEYLENVMKKRGSRWLGLYKECKELNQ